MQKQVLVKLDEKGRIMLPKRIRKNLKVESGQSLLLSYSNSLVLIKRLKKLKSNDRLLRDLDYPIHVDNQRLKKVDLNRAEEEMWYP